MKRILATIMFVLSFALVVSILFISGSTPEYPQTIETSVGDFTVRFVGSTGSIGDYSIEKSDNVYRIFDNNKFIVETSDGSDYYLEIDPNGAFSIESRTADGSIYMINPDGTFSIVFYGGSNYSDYYRIDADGSGKIKFEYLSNIKTEDSITISYECEGVYDVETGEATGDFNFYTPEEAQAINDAIDKAIDNFDSSAVLHKIAAQIEELIAWINTIESNVEPLKEPAEEMYREGVADQLRNELEKVENEHKEKNRAIIIPCAVCCAVFLLLGTVLIVSLKKDQRAEIEASAQKAIESGAKKCPSCGELNSPTKRFCSSCGEQL